MNRLRKTTQHILPVSKESHGIKGEYDIYPTHDIGEGKIHSDYASLARSMAQHASVTIDGYGGVRFDLLREGLDREFAAMGIEPVWWSVGAAMKPEEEVNRLAEPWLGGDDPIFGFRTPLDMADLFYTDALACIKPDPAAQLNILVGEGAALAGWDGLLVYVDIPKNEIQFRARAGSITNLGAGAPDTPKKMYKRFYFFDWVILNRHKKALLSHVDVVVDGQRGGEITWVAGDDLRRGLTKLSRNALRVRPWFEPGVWGGSWIKDRIGSLARDVPNYAWSFELIVPENGILLSSGGRMLEVSFDSVMYLAGRDVVGDECYGKYGDEFPLRMDWLDNFDGGNLSIQCHPRREYIQKHFGEVLTQEESYYMLDTKDGAQVYLGFQDDIEPEKFEAALRESYENQTPLDVDRYVQSLPSRRHELFLIPPGTLHSSGRNNLVLEISTTPYIFTFKMYDWLAVDLDGSPRPLNISRAMDNLYFDRKGDRVERELVSHPVLLEKGADWELWHLKTHPQHSFDVHRYRVSGSIEVSTEGKCNVLNLVEGESAEIITASGEKYRLNYAETIIIAASAGSYRLVNTSAREIMVVKAFMK